MIPGMIFHCCLTEIYEVRKFSYDSEDIIVEGLDLNNQMMSVKSSTGKLDAGVKVCGMGVIKRYEKEDESPLPVSRQKPFFCLKWLKIKAFWE